MAIKPSNDLKSTRNGTITSPRSHAVAPFRHLIPPPGHPKVSSLPNNTALKWCELKKEVSELAWFLKRLDAASLEKPYRGFTTDGHVRDGVFNYEIDEGAPVEAMVKAAEELLSLLSPEQKTVVTFDSVEADEIRIWSNPEIYLNPGETICIHSFPTCGHFKNKPDPVRWDSSR